MSALELAQKIKARFGDLISEPAEFRGEITLKIADAEKIADVCRYARNDLDFNYLVDISSVDNYGDDPRWTVVYHLRGLTHGAELRLKIDVSEEKSELPTVTAVWKTASRWCIMVLTLYSVGRTFLFWQTPHFLDFAESSKHLFVFFVNGRSFRQVEKMDHVSMGTGHMNKRIEATNTHAIIGDLYTGPFPAYVFIGHIGGVVHDVRQVCGVDAFIFIRVYVRP